jgi:putative transposase
MRRDAGKVSLLFYDLTVKALPQINKTVGIDAGITSLVATSDGEKIANPRHFKRLRYPLSLAVKVCGANIRPDGHKSKGQLRKTTERSRSGKKQKPKSC